MKKMTFVLLSTVLFSCQYDCRILIKFDLPESMLRSIQCAVVDLNPENGFAELLNSNSKMPAWNGEGIVSQHDPDLFTTISAFWDASLCKVNAESLCLMDEKKTATLLSIATFGFSSETEFDRSNNEICRPGRDLFLMNLPEDYINQWLEKARDDLFSVPFFKPTTQ